eukprot:GEMP01004636.1.p1 GENE.GEMP01004636.1~~GEMP01004636.1.p1  ORF type:complete len:706 (+),score=118.36 GEMP01004636.1:205-2322(+)
MYGSPIVSPRIRLKSIVVTPKSSPIIGEDISNGRGGSIGSTVSASHFIEKRTSIKSTTTSRINNCRQRISALSSSASEDSSVAPSPIATEGFDAVPVHRSLTISSATDALERNIAALAAAPTPSASSRAPPTSGAAPSCRDPETPFRRNVLRCFRPSELLDSSGGLSMKVWTKVITEYTSISTVLRTASVCKDWAVEAVSSKWMQECVLKGNVVGQEQRLLWRYCTKADEVEAYWKKYFKVKTGYDAYDFLRSDAREPEKAAEIDRDVPRTFPAHPKFQKEESRRCLQGVLRAISTANPKVGYCQGMNFVVAVFLLHLDFDEAQATWLVLAFMKNYSYDQLYSPGVPLLPLRTSQFSGLIKKHLLPVYAHLQSNGFTVDIFSHQWMMTLFAYIVDPSFLADIWNVIFFVGWKAIFQAGLGIMSHLMADILEAKNLEEISHVVHSQKKRIERMGEGVSRAEALAKVFRCPQKLIKTKELRALAKEYILQKWDVFLTTDVVPPGFALAPKGSQTPNLLIDADAFVCLDSPPWKREPLFEGPISKNVNLSYNTLKRIREDLLAWDAVVKADVEVFQRRVATSLRELQDFERTHQELHQDVVAQQDSMDEFREFKQTLIESLYATSVESSPQKATIAGLNNKLIETERRYVGMCDQLAAMEDTWTPLREELEELQMKKAMVMEQFSAFIGETDRKRHNMIELSWDTATR